MFGERPHTDEEMAQNGGMPTCWQIDPVCKRDTGYTSNLQFHPLTILFTFKILSHTGRLPALVLLPSSA